MKNSLKHIHPAVSVLFFLTVIIVSLVVKNPVYIAISLAAGGSCAFLCGGKRSASLCALWGGIFTLLSTLLTPIFYHGAVGFLLGFFIGLSVLSVIFWGYCAFAALDSEKIMFLFGRYMPHFALFLNRVFGFLPLFLQALKSISLVQRGLGCDYKTGKLSQRVKNAKVLFRAALLSAKRQYEKSALAAAVYGFGKKRTNYSLHRFRLTDAVFLLYLLVFGIFSAIGAVKLASFEGAVFSYHCIFWLFLCLLPFIIYVSEVVKCQLYQQKI